MAATAVISSSPAQDSLQPDISYAPDFEKYQARVKRRLASEKLNSTLPAGFPQALASDFVWEGDDFKGTHQWIYELDETEIQEIEDALKHFKSLQTPSGYINRETFPLPRLHQRLRDISKDLHFGRGFAVLRGLPVDNHTREENVIIYAGVSSHVASVRGRQDKSFNGKSADVVLAHIKDLSNTADKDRIGAPAYTTDKQVFHTDSGNIVSLFALSTAAKGGQSKLASSWRVYNELAATRPDLIRTLAEPWPADSFNGKFVSRPLIYHQPAKSANPERLVIQYARRYFTGYHALARSKEIPPITEAQAEALDAIHFLAERFAIGLDFRKGDVQYVNNMSIYHARDEFTDTPEQQRHLLRLWLRDEEFAWETPTPLIGRWNDLYAGVEPENEVFPLEPQIRSASDGVQAKKTTGNS